MIQESAGISFGIEHADEVIQVFQRSRCPDSAFLRRSPLEVRSGSFLRYRRHLLQDDSLHHAAGQTCSANVNLLSSSIQRECFLQIHRPGIELLSHPQRSELGIAMTPRDEILERTTSSPVWYVGHMKADAFEIIDYFRRHPPRDRKSTRLNSSHGYISYAVFCLKKKKNPDAAYTIA